MRSANRLPALLIACFVSFGALAARAPVDERQVNTQREQPQPMVNQQQAEMFFQLKELQEEIRLLRGMVEEMSYELNQLKQRQQDDYLDLDRRISNASPGVGGNPTGGNSAVPANPIGAPLGTPQTSDAEQQDYNRAQRLLQDRQFSEAVTAFEQYIARYPDGKYVANCYYWLGQVHRVNDELEKARDAFAMVVNNYPASNKALDAAYKLGQTYHQLGDNAKARELLEKVASGSSESARQARQYLNDNL